MMKKRWIAAILFFAVLLTACPMAALAETEVLLNQQFDGEVTNRAPADITVAAGKVRVIDDGTQNKALLLEDNGQTKVWYASGKADYMILSMDIKRAGAEAVSFTLQTTQTATQNGTFLLRSDENRLVTKDNKTLGGLNEGRYTHLTFAINNKRNLYDIYVDGKLAAKQWKLDSQFSSGILFDKSRGGLIVDNLIAYSGTEMDAAVPAPGYSPDGDAYIEYDYTTNADRIFFDNEHLSDVAWDESGNYAYSTTNAKSNKITLDRLEQRLDPNRTDSYIIMEKLTDEDLHLDINSLNRHGAFPYYYFGGMVRVDQKGPTIHLGVIRDSVTTGSNVDATLLTIDPQGRFVTKDGLALRSVSAGEWVEFAVVLDIGANRGSVYIDGELAADNIYYTANLKQPTMIRLWLNGTGKGKATFDKVKVIGMRQPYDPDVYTHKPVFSDDSGIAAYLADKTAFHLYSENVFGSGSKHVRIDKPMEKDSQIYVTANALNVGYGLSLAVNAAEKSASGSGMTLTADSKTVTYQEQTVEMEYPCVFENETLYVPVETFARTVLGHQVVRDNNGLVVTSQNPFYLQTEEKTPEYLVEALTGYSEADYTPVKVLNWYMAFERPTAATLQADFNAGTDNGAMHPRIIATKEDFDRVRELRNTDAYVSEMVDSLLAAAEGYVDSLPPAFAILDKQRILDQARTALNRFRSLGFAYQITGDKKYSDAIWRDMQAFLSYPDWNPSHLIDGAELCAAVAIGYDWAYDSFTPEQRQFIYDGVKRLGLEDFHDAYYDLLMIEREWASANNYVDSKTNFNTVINGGVITALVAFAEMDPDFCFGVLQNAIRSMEYSMLMYGPDGIWLEGAGYWDYACSYLSKGVGALMNAMGSHYGLLDAQGVSKTALWIRSMDSYGGSNNFHDAGAGRIASPFIGWFAKVFDTPALSASRKNQITSGVSSPQVEDAFWYLPGNTATEDDLPLDVYCKGLDTVSIRASYTDNDALYFSTHGGVVFCYHSQADVGSFILDLMGLRWAADLGMEDYNLQRDGSTAGYYTAYRRRAEAHNVMVFNPDISGGMNDDAYATTTLWESKDRGAMAAYDLSMVYDQYVSAYERGYYVGDDRRSLTVRDEFTTLTNMPAYWFMTTPAEVEILDNNTAILTQAGKKLQLQLITDMTDYTLTVGPAAPLDTSPVLEGQNANAGYSRIALKGTATGGQPHTVTVKLAPLSEDAASTPVMDTPIHEWTLPDGEYVPRPALNARIFVNGRDMNEIATNGKIGIIEGEELPVVTAEPENPENIVEILPGDPPTAYTTVRVYTPDRSTFNDFYVEYSMSESADLSGYEELDVVECNVSSAPEAENQKENMFDGDFTSRWSSANQVGEWAIFDLGSPQDIDAVGMAFWRGDTRNYLYELQVSNDGETWTTVSTGQSSGETEGFETVEFDRVNARYLKFLGSGNTVNGHSNILEFSILRKK